MDQFDKYLQQHEPTTAQRPQLKSRVSLSIQRHRIARRFRWILLTLAVATAGIAIATMIKHGLIDLIRVTISKPGIIKEHSGLYWAAVQDALPLISVLAMLATLALWIVWYHFDALAANVRLPKLGRLNFAKLFSSLSVPAVASLLIATSTTAVASYVYTKPASSEHVTELQQAAAPEDEAVIVASPSPSPSPVVTQPIAETPIFDTCGSSEKYADKPWLIDLQTKVESAVARPIKELCYAANTESVIVIAEDASTAANAGAKLGMYHIANGELNLVARDFKGEERANRGNFVFGKQHGGGFVQVIGHAGDVGVGYNAYFEYDTIANTLVLSRTVDVKVYASNGISFEHPTDYQVNDHGLAGFSSLGEALKSGPVTIEVISPAGAVTVTFTITADQVQHLIQPPNSSQAAVAEQIVITFRRQK